MKSLPKALTFLFLAAFTFLSTQAVAQSSCSALPVVASGCVGDCGTTTTLSYTYNPCISATTAMCLRTDNSNLCASHAAFARVFVDGVLVASGNITAAGSEISFNLPCGSTATAQVTTKLVDKNIHCIVFGSVNVSLRSQF